MTELLQFFTKLVEYFGQTNASIILAIMVIVYSIYSINKTYSSIIKKYLESKLKEKEERHEKAIEYRKCVNPKIREELSRVALEIGADRAMVFEFSNGSSNLIGLPFMYASATGEVMESGTPPVSQNYQKVNTSILAHFLENLEDKGYFYTADITEIEKEYPIVFGLMSPNKAKTALFYCLYGSKNTIGFVVVTTTRDGRTFTREDALPKLAKSAQKISALLTYKEIQEEL